MWKYFVLGLLAGWLIEWVIDWLYWRRTPVPVAAAASGWANAQPAAADPESVRSSMAATWRAPSATADRVTSPAPVSATGSGESATDEGGTSPPEVESNTGTSTSADTPAGRVGSDAALGSGGAVSTSSATLTSTAPVYRQEDLEAIDGIDPKTGAALRSSGITTFAELAVTRVDELARIVENAGRPPQPGWAATWQAQARLAASGKWAELARMQKEAADSRALPQSGAREA